MFKNSLKKVGSKNRVSRRSFIGNSALLWVAGLGAAVAAAAETGGVSGGDGNDVYPRSIIHVGLTVPDIEAALKGYMKVFGWTRLFEPAVSVAREGYMGELAADLYGPAFRENKMAMLSSGNGCNVEFFEYINPDTKKFKQPEGPWVPGYSHICVMDPDVEGMVKRIVTNGGKQVSKLWDVIPGGMYPYKICYTQDPWGNHIEVCSRSSENTMAPR